MKFMRQFKLDRQYLTFDLMMESFATDPVQDRRIETIRSLKNNQQNELDLLPVSNIVKY